MAGAQVLDHLVGLQHVAADLVPPANIGLGRRFRVRRFLALLQLDLVEPRLQHRHRRRTVLVLAALLLAGDDHAAWNVGNADCRVGGVDVLAAGTRRAVGVDLEVRLVDLNVDRLVDHWIHPGARKAGVAASRAVVRRDADEPVHARFRLQPAISIVAGDLDGRGFDAGFFAVVHFHDVDLELPPLRPARVHAQEDIGPVLALGAAGAGVNLEIGVIRVGLAREQRLDLRRTGVLQRLLQRLLGLADHIGVVLGLAHFDELGIVADGGLEGLHGLHLHVQLIALLHDRPGLLGGGPEVGMLGPCGQIVEAGFSCIPVKDASSAGLRPARFRR